MLRPGVSAYLLYRCGPLILPIIRAHRCDASAESVDTLVPVEKPGYTPPLDLQGGTITAHTGWILIVDDGRLSGQTISDYI